MAMIPLAAYRGMQMVRGGRRIGTLAQFSKRARTAAGYRGTAGLTLGGMLQGRKGRKKGRSNRRRKTDLRKRIGEFVGSGTAKRNQDVTTGSLNTRTLYNVPLLNIPKGTAIDQRERGLVNFRGMKFCHSMEFRDPTLITSAANKLWINRAIISPKGCDTDPITANFFRGEGTGRAQDFDVALSSLEFHCTPINTDKYNVHMHRREKLGPFQSTEGRGAAVRMWYTKLNRQIRYDDDGEVPIGKQMYYVWWFDINTGPAASPAVNSMMSHSLHITKYFKEPKN